MGKRNLKSGKPKVTLAKSVFDLRGEYVGGQPASSHPMEVPDAITPGHRAVVFRSLRDDPLAMMHAHGHIDDAQYLGGRRWQQYREDSQIGPLSAIDPTIEPVDGGEFKEPDITRMSRALAELRRADAGMQEYDKSIVYDVLVRNMSISEIAAARSITSGRQICSLMDRFRDKLDGFARLWGFA